MICKKVGCTGRMTMAFLRSVKKGQESFANALLRLFAVLLIFGGPTYLLYILDRLDVPRLLVLLVGLAAFTVGVVLFAYLSKGEGTEASS